MERFFAFEQSAGEERQGQASFMNGIRSARPACVAKTLFLLLAVNSSLSENLSHVMIPETPAEHPTVLFIAALLSAGPPEHIDHGARYRQTPNS